MGDPKRVLDTTKLLSAGKMPVPNSPEPEAHRRLGQGPPTLSPAPAAATATSPSTPAASAVLRSLAPAAARSSTKSAVLTLIEKKQILRAVKYRKNPLKNPERRSNAEAIAAYQRGVLPQPECTNCKRGNGPFVKCVQMDGQFGGACCNCKVNDGQAACSFYGKFYCNLMLCLLVILMNLQSHHVLSQPVAVLPPPSPPSPPHQLQLLLLHLYNLPSYLPSLPASHQPPLLL
jgi:hypothetical protein